MLDREVQALGPEAIMRMVQEAGSTFSPSSALPFGGEAKPPFAESKVPQIVEDVLAEKAAERARSDAQSGDMADGTVPAPEDDAPQRPEAALTTADALAALEAPEPSPEPDAFTPAPPPEAIDLEALRAEAFEAGRAEALAEVELAREEGYRQGKADALEEQGGEMEEARAMFLKAAEAFETQAAAAGADIKGQIKEAVRTLASQRAGQAIDALPLPFMVRIMKLAQQISHASGQAALRLHPDDLKAVKPHLPDSGLPKDVTLQADPDMSRGDVDFSLGALSVKDLLDPKYSMDKG